MSRMTFLLALLAPAFASAQDELAIDRDAGATPNASSQSYNTGTMVVNNSGSGLSIGSPNSANPFWSITLQPPAGLPLVAGCYERAKRSSTQGRPAFAFGFGGSGCNASYSRFKVLDIQRNGSNNVTSLALDFSQQCESYGGAVRGQLRFNSAIPISPTFLRPVVDSTGTLAFTAQPGAVGSSAPSGMASIQLLRQVLRPSINGDNGTSFSYSGPLPGGISTGFFGLDFAAAGDVVLVPGSYPNATRYPFQASNAPGLAFSYNGSGCNTLAGSFNVSDAVMDGLDPVPLSFSATFQQHCPDAAGPLTSGTINFSANILGPVTLPLFSNGFEDASAAGSHGLYTATCAE